MLIIMPLTESQIKDSYQQQIQKIIAAEKKEGGYSRGIVFTHNLSLVYGAKSHKPHKRCEIPDAMDECSGLSTHNLQAITETFPVHQWLNQGTAIKTTYDLAGFPFQPRNTNFLLVNIGCVITDIGHVKNGSHRRIFITTPIRIYYSPCSPTDSPHSEAFLVEDFLRRKDVVKGIINQLLEDCRIKQDAHLSQRKIYTLVFDLHSTQDICDECEQKIFNFQIREVGNIKDILQEMGFKVPSDAKDSFKVVFRVSASREPSASWYRKPLHQRDNKMEAARIHTHDIPMDIRRSNSPLILHSDEKMRGDLAKWYDPKSYEGLPLFRLPSQTIFRNQCGFFKCELPKYIPADPVDVQNTLIATVPVLAASAKTDKENNPIAKTVVDYMLPTVRR
jgi:hypothetical protein